MKRFFIAALSLAFGLAAPRAFAQSTPTPTPLDRIEILGRLATGYSPSYIAYLVKTRSLSFSVSASFLDQVAQAGGRGILVDTLPHAASPNSIARSSDGGPSIDHLAKCAAMFHTGDLDNSELECRASIVENPANPWPLLLTAGVIARNIDGSDADEQSDPKKTEALTLLRRAAALAPGIPMLHSFLDASASPSIPATRSAQVASESDPRDDAERSAEFSPGSAYVFSDPPGQGAKTLSPEPNDFANTVEFMAHRMREQPDLASSHVDLAEMYANVPRYFDSTANEFREAIRLEPDNPGIRLRLAIAYHLHGDVDAAIAELRETVRIAPYGTPERVVLARELQTAGRIPDALNELQAIVAIHPADRDASDALVELFIETKDSKSAIAELRRSLKTAGLSFTDESRFVDQRWSDENRLAELLKETRDLDGAAEQYLYLTRFKPGDAGVHNDYGNVLLDQHRCDEAIDEYNEAMRLDPNMAQPHNNVGLCLAMKEELDGAINEFRAALERDANSPHSRAFLGMALLQKGDLKAAEDDFRELIERNPNDPEARMDFAMALTLMKRDADAIAELKKAMELEPDSPAAENNLAWIYATSEDRKLRNPAEALRLAQLAVKTSPEPNAAFIDTLAEAQLINGNADEALATEMHAAKLDPNNPELQKRVAHFQEEAEKNSKSATPAGPR
jgi:Flp pilus assembly protein TadD